MGFLSGVLGSNSSYQASPNDVKFQGAQIQNNAPVLNPVGLDQAAQTYGQTQGGLAQQQNFVNALQAQGGLNNQSQVFAQQQALANQLGQQAQGQGPNPALDQFNQATGQNVAQQAALMGSQRGVGANAGLLARQAAMQGANIQQNAVGQSATLQAQQQIAAQQQLAAQQAQMAGVANSQVGQQANAINNYGQQAGANYGQALGAIANQNTANISNQSALNNANVQNQSALNQANLNNIENVRNVNSGTAQKNAETNGKIGGGILNAAGAAAGLTMAHGGEVPGCYAEGGPTSMVGRHLMKSGGHVPGKASVQGDSLKNDTVPAMLSPGEVVIPRHVMQSKDPAKAAAAFVAQVMAKKPSTGINHDDGGFITPEQEAAAGGQMANQMFSNLGSGIRSVASDIGNTKVVSDMGKGFSSAGNAISDLTGKEEDGAEEGDTQPAGQNASEIPAPTQDTTPSAPVQSGSQDPTSPMAKSFGDVKAGLSKEAAAIGNQGKQEAAVLGEQQNALQKVSDDYKPQYAQVDQEREKLTNDILNGHIDPNRLVGNMSTPQKVGTAIGLILSGIGSGLTGQENMASKYLQTQISNDIDSQKADLGKKENLLSANFRRFGNLKEAEQMTRANLNDMTILKMKQVAASSQDPIAKARLQTEIGKLTMQNEQAMLPFRIKNQIIQAGGAGGQDATSLIRMIPDQKEQAEAQKEYSKAQDIKEKFNATMESWNQVNKAAHVGYAMTNPQRALSGAQTSQLNAAIAELNKTLTGRFNPEENKRLMEQFAPSMRDTQEDRMLKQQNLMKYASMGQNFPTLEKYNIKPDNFASTSTSAVQRAHQRLQANPNDIKAKNFLMQNGAR